MRDRGRQGVCCCCVWWQSNPFLLAYHCTAIKDKVLRLSAAHMESIQFRAGRLSYLESYRRKNGIVAFYSVESAKIFASVLLSSWTRKLTIAVSKCYFFFFDIFYFYGISTVLSCVFILLFSPSLPTPPPSSLSLSFRLGSLYFFIGHYLKLMVRDGRRFGTLLRESPMLSCC